MAIQIPRSPHPCDASEFAERLRWITTLTHINTKKSQKEKRRERHSKKRETVNLFKPFFVASCMFTFASIVLFCLSATIKLFPDSFITKVSLFVQTILCNGGL